MAEETRPATATAAAEESLTPTAAAAATGGSNKKQQQGFLSRTWKRLLGGEDDFEKRLQHLSKEENLVHTRMRNRARTSRKMSTYIIIFFLLSEVVAVVYAIMKRSLELDWETRALNVLPMFLIPAVSFIAYSTFLKYIRMRDRKDQKTLEKLRAERQAKIDELKERTNYYTTQQLIQKYDPDPAAKAAAATVLASKLGAETGLKVYLGDDSKVDAAGKSNDVQLGQSNTGLRNRKQSQHVRSHSAGSSGSPSYIEESPSKYVADSSEANVYDQRMVEHYKGVALHDGGWLARIAALLVGEDPTQCYALICGNCHMHNGLARKEDFPYITYYCPHCHALNGSRIAEEQVSPSSSVVLTPAATGEAVISPTGSSTSSVTGSDAKSNLATVEELPELPSVDSDDNKKHEGNTK